MNGNLTKIKQKKLFSDQKYKKTFRTLFWKCKNKNEKNVKEASFENAKKCQNSKSHLQSQKKNNFASKKMCGQRQKSDENKQNRSVSEKNKIKMDF